MSSARILLAVQICCVGDGRWMARHYRGKCRDYVALTARAEASCLRCKSNAEDDAKNM